MPRSLSTLFFFNDTATAEIYTLSLHDALPISGQSVRAFCTARGLNEATFYARRRELADREPHRTSGTLSEPSRSEEHTSELQSRQYLVCRLLLEKKKAIKAAARFSCTLRCSPS